MADQQAASFQGVTAFQTRRQIDNDRQSLPQREA